MGVRSYDGLSDQDLVQMAANEPEAVGQLFRRHARAVYAYCARRTGDLDLAEDLTSVVFLEALRHRKVQLSGTSALPWLLGVANNITRNAERSLRRYRSALGRVQPAPESAGPEDDAIGRIAAQEALTLALHALRPLSPGERDVVLLVLWGELSYADAALSLGIPVGTVRSRLASARQKFASVMTRPVFSQEHP
jgi:RNA polymerase sigma factor (sigma-70 family)